MSQDVERRYRISEVSSTTGIPAYLLRKWEAAFPQLKLKVKRDRANRRYYTAEGIEIVRRLKQLLRHEKMTYKGAAERLAQELRGEGRPKTRQEVFDLLDKIETEVRDMLDLLGPD